MVIDYVTLHVDIRGKVEYIDGIPLFPSENYTIFLDKDNWEKVKKYIDDIKNNETHE